jgi:Planctomycete cytochrome C
MLVTLRNIVFLMVISLLATGCSEQVSFENDVMPILSANCLSCHGDNGEGFNKSGFSVKDYDSVMIGTKFGTVIVPGDSASSTLYRLVAHLTDPKIQMPPHHEDALAVGRGVELTPEQIETIRKWIDQGAKKE